MMKKKISPVTIGDQYLRLGVSQTLWEVIELKDFDGLPQHARLRAVGGHNMLTFAVSAVNDRELFKKISAGPQAAVIANHAQDKRVNNLFGLQGG